VRKAGSSVEFGTVAQLQRLLSDTSFDAGQVSKLIATDPVLSGKVLRLANSSAFGVSGKVDSIGHALMLIGTSNIVNHLCFDSLSRAFSEKTVLTGHSVASLWQHATATSICALFVGYLFPEINKGKLYTIALLHDIGKFVMGDLPPLSPDGQANESHAVANIFEEEELYGINHALLGSLILEGWQIPDSIAKPVELHHHPFSVSMKDLGGTVEKLHGTVVLYIADQLARVFTSADGEALPVLPLHHSYRKLLDRQQLEQNVLSSPLTTEVRKALALTQRFASSVLPQPAETAPR
jgi:HD-like signal output (HDOD) protein